MECSETSELVLPLDLRQWVSAPVLRDWLMEAINQLNWTSPELHQVLRRFPEFEAKAVLTITVYAYLTGTFSSEEIVEECAAMPEYRTIRPKLAPRVEEITAFRKNNRSVLLWVISQVLQRALKSRFIEDDEIELLPPGLRRYAVQNATERLEIARHLDRSAII